MADLLTGRLSTFLEPGLAREVRLFPRMESHSVLNEPAKIQKAAHDFETVLLGHWLEQAQESLASAPGGDEDDEDGTRSQFQAIGMQSLATAITQAGGIGIAR